MSTPLAIAAVTAVLKDVLNTAMTAHDLSSIVGTIHVTAQPPDRIVPQNGEGTGLNLFLYQVSHNQGWRNANLPVRNADGARIDNAPLALDLHYLLTATGEKDLWPEIVMGYAMQMLHETGVLSRELIRAALNPSMPPADLPKELKFSELADQVEQIRVTPASLSIDDISKLWTGFQGRYRLSTAYLATVVLIKTDRSTRPSLPVVTRNIAVRPFQTIIIDTIATEDGAYAQAGATLRLTGSGLDDPNFQLLIDGADRTALVTGKAPTWVTFKLPGPVGGALQAGTLGVQVAHPIEFAPGVTRGANQSNLVPFVLHPTIVPSGTFTHTVTGGVTYAKGTLKLAVDPKVTATQRVLVLLNSTTPGGPAYSFPIATGNGIVAPATDTANLSLDLDSVVASTYLVRVSVDGADSPLSLTGGTYTAPAVTL